MDALAEGQHKKSRGPSRHVGAVLQARHNASSYPQYNATCNNNNNNKLHHPAQIPSRTNSHVPEPWRTSTMALSS